MDWQRSSAGAGQLLLCVLMSFTLTHAWSLAAIATPDSHASWSPVVAAKTATPTMGRQLNRKFSQLVMPSHGRSKINLLGQSDSAAS